MLRQLWASDGKEGAEMFAQAPIDFVRSFETLSLHPGFKNALLQLSCALASGLPVLLIGAVGSGKTTAVKAAAKAVGQMREVLSWNMTKQTEFKQLVSQPMFDKDGQLTNHDGILLEACKEGRWALLENMEGASPQLVNALCGVLQQAEKSLAHKSTRGTRQQHLLRCLSTLSDNDSVDETDIKGAEAVDGLRVIGTYVGDLTSIPTKLLNHFAVVTIEAQDGGLPLSEMAKAAWDRSDEPKCKEAIALMSNVIKRKCEGVRTSPAHLQSLVMRGAMSLLREQHPEKGEEDSIFVNCLLTSFVVSTTGLKGGGAFVETLTGLFGVAPKHIRLMTPEISERLRVRCFVEEPMDDGITVSPIEAILFIHITGLPMLLEGPPAVGKTFDVTQAASAVDKSILTVMNTDSTTVHDYFGGYEMKGGGFRYAEGPLARAMQQGCWFLADELNLASSEVHNMLQPLIELLPIDQDGSTSVRNPITGEDITIDPGFRFFAAQNPSARSLGRKKLPRAFACRLLTIQVPECVARRSRH